LLSLAVVVAVVVVVVAPVREIVVVVVDVDLIAQGMSVVAFSCDQGHSRRGSDALSRVHNDIVVVVGGGSGHGVAHIENLIVRSQHGRCSRRGLLLRHWHLLLDGRLVHLRLFRSGMGEEGLDVARRAAFLLRSVLGSDVLEAMVQRRRRYHIAPISPAFFASPNVLDWHPSSQHWTPGSDALKVAFAVPEP